MGEEQSGHIREVGYELYQSMLEEAVAAIRGGEGGVIEDQWSPRINLGTSVLIPEDYVPDLQVRLGLYRRLSGVESHDAIEGFAAELIDRFGPLPQEVRHLLDVVEIKGLCRQAGIEQIDAGPKGAVIAFRNKTFANPEGLIAFIREEGKRVKLQPDHRLIYYGELGDARGAAYRRARASEAPRQDRRQGETGGLVTIAVDPAMTGAGILAAYTCAMIWSRRSRPVASRGAEHDGSEIAEQIETEQKRSGAEREQPRIDQRRSLARWRFDRVPRRPVA